MAMWKTRTIRLQRYIAVWPDTLKKLVNDWLRSGNSSHQSLMIEDCMTAQIISLWLIDTKPKGYFFQQKVGIDDRQKELVERLRGEGWTFTYMGANQDSVEVAMKLSIRNSRNFAYSHEGTRASMGKDTSTRMNFFSRLSCMKMQEADGCAAPMSAEERHNLYTSMADEAFDEEEGR